MFGIPLEISDDFLFTKEFWLVVCAIVPLLFIYFVMFVYVVYGMCVDLCRTESAKSTASQTDLDYPYHNAPRLPTIIVTNGTSQYMLTPSSNRRSKSYGSNSNEENLSKGHTTPLPPVVSRGALYHQIISNEELHAAKSSLRRTPQSNSERCDKTLFSSILKTSEGKEEEEVDLLDFSALSCQHDESSPKPGDYVTPAGGVTVSPNSACTYFGSNDVVEDSVHSSFGPNSTQVKILDKSSLSHSRNVASPSLKDLPLPPSVETKVSSKRSLLPVEAGTSSSKPNKEADDPNWTEVYLGEI